MNKKTNRPEEQSGPYVYEKPLKAAPETASKARVISTNLASVGAVLIASQILVPANAETVSNSQTQSDGVSLAPTSDPIASGTDQAAVSESNVSATDAAPVMAEVKLKAPKLKKLPKLDLSQPAAGSGNTSSATGATSGGSSGSGSGSGNTSSSTGASSGGSGGSGSGSSSGNTSSSTGASSGRGDDDDDDRYEGRDDDDEGDDD